MNQIGHNQPPKSAFEIIDDFCSEAEHWIDGVPLVTEHQAHAVGELMGLLKTARADCDAERKVKVKPLDDAKAAIQAEYNPFLAKAATALDSLKALRDRWLRDEQKRIDDAAREAREQAEATERAAVAAIRGAQTFEEKKKAAVALSQAMFADAEARRLAKSKPANVGGRRTVTPDYDVTLIDATLAVEHYWTHRRHEFDEMLVGLARADAKRGLKSIPGFEIREIT